MDATTLQVSVVDKVCLIVLNRPKTYNAFNLAQYTELASALKYADSNKSVSVIVITGNGAYYSSGNDLTEFAQNFQAPGRTKLQFASASRKILYAFVKALMDVQKPVIAGVNGPAIGLAVTTLPIFDFVYCNNTATFHTPFSAIGQSPECLSSYTFPKIMGIATANAVLMLGQKLTADEAVNCHLVHEVWKCDSNAVLFREKLMTVAKKLASYPSQGLIEVKEMMKSHERDILLKVLEVECDLCFERWQSKECENAMMKFFMRKMMKKKGRKSSKL